MSAFAGFPDGAMAATPIPNLFFARLLPEIDSLAELKVTLHVLWRTGPGPRQPSWLGREALARDSALLTALAAEAGGGAAAVSEGLRRAVERGTLLLATVRYADAEREVVAANNARGRRGLAALRARAAETHAPAPPPAASPLPGSRLPIFILYEENIGLIGPLIADELRAAADLYPAAWVEDAFHQAVTYNRRSWRYVKRILERWATEGKDADAAPWGRVAGQGPPTARRRWSQNYRPGDRLPDL